MHRTDALTTQSDAYVYAASETACYLQAGAQLVLRCEPLQHGAYALCKDTRLLYAELHNTALVKDIKFALLRLRDSEQVLHKVYVLSGRHRVDMFTA